MFAVESIIQLGPLSSCGELLGFRSVAVLCGLGTFYNQLNYLLYQSEIELNIASSLVHASYSWRIRILGGSWIVIGTVMVLSFVQCVMVSISGFGDFNTGNEGLDSLIFFSRAEVGFFLEEFLSGLLPLHT